MTITNVITVVGTFAGTMIAVLTLAWNFSRAQDAKVSRVYKRLDEVKDANKQEFVLKDVCQVLNQKLSDDVAEIKADVKKLLTINGKK